MEKFQSNYIEQSEAWIRTQQSLIDSCDLNIKHFQEQIEMLEKHIQLEREEKAAKQKTLDAYLAKLEDYKQQAQ